MSTDVKEVYMDLALSDNTPSTRGRRRTVGGGRRKTKKQEGGGGSDVSVIKAEPSPAPPSSGELAPVSQSPVILGSPNTAVPQIIGPASVQTGGSAVGKAKVVIAPPKKKTAKVVFVPKAKGSGSQRVKDLKKTFKAKRFRVVIDNTAKTLKARKQTLGRVDGMTDEQVRVAAVSAKLVGAERAKKTPVGLQRQMLKDYQTMRGAML
jgi:hypothetical protein